MSSWLPCRGCGLSEFSLGASLWAPRHRAVVPMLNMGSLPLANRLENPGSISDKAYPLVVYYCHNCALMQLPDLVPWDEMFTEYVYLTSASKTMMEHFDRYAEALSNRLDLTTRDSVLDVGSNDRTLLKAFHSRGVRAFDLFWTQASGQGSTRGRAVPRGSGILSDHSWRNPQRVCFSIF